MGMLTGPEIEKQVGLGRIVIDPFDAERLNSNSYNLRLSPTLMKYDMTDLPPAEWGSGGMAYLNPKSDKEELKMARLIDMAVQHPTVSCVIPTKGLLLEPGKLYLGATVEKAGSDHYIPMVEGRSSIGRLGMFVHVTAGFGDQGFKDTWTLEIMVVHPLRVYPLVEVAQVAFHEAVGLPLPYRGKYVGQTGPRASGLWKEFQNGKYARA